MRRIHENRRFTALEIARMTRRDRNSLLFALENARPPPCMGCQHYDSCAADHLACSKFMGYVNQSSGGDRIPSKIIYDKIFSDDCEEEDRK